MHVSNLHIKLVSEIVLTFFLVFVISTLQVNAQNNEDIAKSGDGIYSVLKRNGLDPKTYSNAFIELNKDKLGKDNSLYKGVKYKLPSPVEVNDKPSTDSNSGNAVKRFDIFGNKYANVEIKSNELKGAIYYLISGHGGPDPGAVGRYNNQQLCEDEYAYDVTLRMARNLIEKGATVYMITIDKNDGIRDESILKADKDELCYPDKAIPLNQMKRLRQRVDATNKLYRNNPNAFQRVIIMHVDSRSKGQNIDIFFYHDIRSNTGKKTAQILQRTFHDKYAQHQPGRGYHGTVSARNLYVLKNTYPVGVYIELANINHQRDIKRLIIADNRQAVANWLTQGLVTDFKTNK